MLSRTGLHAGVTLRVAGKTDISIGYAHFIHEDVRLQVNDSFPASRYEPKFRMAKYNFKPGKGVADLNGAGAELGGFDGSAGVEVPNADVSFPVGPYFINAGSYYYHLDVLSLAFTQHY
jgi:hypothetical protein